MSRCRHEYTRTITRDGREVWSSRRHGAMAEASSWTCRDCGATLPLGPANDTPEVMVEVRAAAIAADWDNYMSCHRWHGLESLGATSPEADHGAMLEADVLLGRSPGRDLVDYYVGHLARCIQDHKETP